MEPQKQVCSLELAKKLKELGVKQESYFAWHKGGHIMGGWSIWNGCQESELQTSPFKESVSAFTVAELGEMLPVNILNGKTVNVDSHKWTGTYTCFADDRLSERDHVDIMPNVGADTEADARAKMLVYLLENKIITL